MAVKQYFVDASDWSLSTRQAKDGTTRLVMVGRDVRISRDRNQVWVPARYRWSAETELELNQVRLGPPTAVRKNGALVWRDVTNEDMEQVLSWRDAESIREPEPTEVESAKTFDPEMQAEPVPEYAYLLAFREVRWRNADEWAVTLDLLDVPPEQTLQIAVYRSDRSGEPRRPVNFIRDYSAKSRSYDFRLSSETSSVAFDVWYTVNGEEHGPQGVMCERPSMETRPEAPDFWAARQLPTARIETRSGLFVPDLIGIRPWGQQGNIDVHYRGSQPVDVMVEPAPGGFSVMWGWKPGLGPVSRNTPGPKRMQDPLRPVWAHIYHRPTAWRGSGCDWRYSIYDGHIRPDGGRIVTIPIHPTVCPPGELIDVIVQGVTFWAHRLPPAHVVTTVVGPEPKGETMPRLSMSAWGMRRFPPVGEPLTANEYALLRDQVTRALAPPDEAVLDETEAFVVQSRIKMRVQRESVVVSISDMRNLCATALPDFTFLTDNYGAFFALPDTVWEEVIEVTNSDAQHYDPAWYTCADFATDFKAAAARLGAKVLNVWDFGGGHAYCILPTVQADGQIVLRFFEPQTDDIVDEQSGQYAQDRGGIVMAW